MFFYIIVGVITTALAQLTVSSYGKNQTLFIVSCFLFIMFPSVIEGCRDVTIGTDMMAYGSVFFYDALRYNDVFVFLHNLDTKEYAYHLLCYICGKYGTINLYMFMAAFIKMILLALTCIHFRKKTIVWMAVWGYMLFFYWYGFSLMRQSLALCVALYSFTFLVDKKYIGFSLCVVISYLFHNSGIFILLMPLILYMLKLKHKLILISTSAIICYLMASVLFIFIASSGLFGESKMDLYLDSGVQSSKTNILILVAFLLFTFAVKKQNERLVFVIQANAIIGLMFLMLSSLFEVAFRVSFYQMLPLLFLFPALLKEYQVGCWKVTGKIMFLLLLLVHIILAAQHGMAETIPYKSALLGI